MQSETRISKSHNRVPVLKWLAEYRKSYRAGDLMAGFVVAIVLLPQAMAYAMLAGLPPQIGLYSCILPILAYAALGTSRTLAVGPVGLMSLMVGAVIAELNLETGPQIYYVAIGLALLSGALLILMYVLRFGMIVNFISHPVLSGFTSAGALLIAISQLKYLLGLDMAKSEHLFQNLVNLFDAIPTANPVTAALGITGISIIVGIKLPMIDRLVRRLFPSNFHAVISKSGPLIAVILGTYLVWNFELDRSDGVSIVGLIPSGLPNLSYPKLEWELIEQLVPMSAVIAVVGFLESVSVAKALASRKRQKINANQELLALGCANIGAAISGGYPVAGGLGRSMVNFNSGANTQLAAVITASLIAVALMFLTPLLYYLPHAVLAAIIIVAVSGLMDLTTLNRVWVYDKSEAVSFVATFLVVLSVGIEWGILFGALISISFHLHRSSEPHIAVVGRVGDSEHFRNVERYPVKTCAHVIAIRVDENLYFANTGYLEDYVMGLIADNPKAEHLVLVCSAVNEIDSSALELLDTLVERLAYAGLTLHLAEVKGPVMDQLKKTPFLERMKPGQVFLSTHQAMQILDCV